MEIAARISDHLRASDMQEADSKESRTIIIKLTRKGFRILEVRSAIRFRTSVCIYQCHSQVGHIQPGVDICLLIFRVNERTPPFNSLVTIKYLICRDLCQVRKIIGELW